MGAGVLLSADDVAKYGELGIRYNGLRAFYNCVRNVINHSGDVKTCT